MNHDDDLQGLIHRYADGQITAGELQRLNELLRVGVAARREFAELLNLDSALGALAAEGTASIEFAQIEKAPRHNIWKVVAIAASLLIAIATVGLVQSSRSAAAHSPFARLTRLAEPVWGQGSIAPLEGERFGKQMLRLKSGAIQITIDSGVVLRVDGPAEAQLVDPMHLRVLSGKVAAEVGPAAKGFSIETPHAEVVDFGTKFVVDTTEADTGVIVEQGEVRVYEKAKNSARAEPVVTLVTGEAARVDRSRRVFRIISVTSDGQEEEWKPHSTATPAAIVTSVRDNLEGGHPSLRNYYRIVPGGMREDARAYADGSHEWNGLDEKGIPSELIGADLVQTFSVDGLNWWLEITLTVSRPCTVYVLADRRTPTPAWLQERFTDTGLDIAREYVAPDRGIPGRKGPARVHKLFPCRVWKLDVAQAGEVKLGPPYFEKFKDASEVRPNSMYGIAVTATEAESQ